MLTASYSVTVSISASNSWTVCRSAVHTIFKVAPKEIITGIHVWQTWWPRPPTTKVLWKSIQQDMVTRHIMQDDQENICCTVWAYVVSTWCAPWMTGVTWFCRCYRYCWFVTMPSTKISPLSLCLLTTQYMVHFARWSDVSTTLCGFSETLNFMFCLFKNPSRWEWAPPCCTPSFTVCVVYLATNSWYSHIQWYHLLLFPLVIPEWHTFKTVVFCWKTFKNF